MTLGNMYAKGARRSRCRAGLPSSGRAKRRSLAGSRPGAELRPADGVVRPAFRRPRLRPLLLGRSAGTSDPMRPAKTSRDHHLRPPDRGEADRNRRRASEDHASNLTQPRPSYVPWSKTPHRCTGRMVASASDARALALMRRVPCSGSCTPIIAWLQVRVLPAPPRSPAQFRFPGATGIVFDFPWLCRREREIARSLSPGIGRCRRKCRPGLWPHQTLSRRNSLSRTETGSNVSRDRFELANSRRTSIRRAKPRRSIA